MADNPVVKIKTEDKIKVEDYPNTVIKGGEIQSVPTSGTTTLTQEMAQALEQSINPSPMSAQQTKPDTNKPAK